MHPTRTYNIFEDAHVNIIICTEFKPHLIMKLKIYHSTYQKWCFVLYIHNHLSDTHIKFRTKMIEFAFLKNHLNVMVKKNEYWDDFNLLLYFFVNRDIYPQYLFLHDKHHLRIERWSFFVNSPCQLKEVMSKGADVSSLNWATAWIGCKQRLGTVFKIEALVWVSFWRALKF